MSQDKEREALEAAWRECRDACAPSDWTTSEAAAYRGFFAHGYRAALASQQAGQGEPVAWLCRRENGILDVLTDQTCTQCFPVYASPPPREPLTDEQIGTMWASAERADHSWTPPSYLRFARAIEAAYGIHSREGESNDH